LAQALITELIDRPDGFELVRDQIAAILLVESQRQQQLASAAGKDPERWRLRVFVEASNPWACWTGDDNDDDLRRDETPIVNVQFDQDSVDLAGSNVVERQKHTGTFFCDCYGYGISTEELGGHTRGDRSAALAAQRAARLVRSILMAAHYTYLGFPRGGNQVVWRRMSGARTMFQPSIDDRAVQRIAGLRYALTVEFNEFSPQVKGVPLELISASVFRDEVDGQLLLRADYTAPFAPQT
jgi:hypothetical protein